MLALSVFVGSVKVNCCNESQKENDCEKAGQETGREEKVDTEAKTEEDTTTNRNTSSSGKQVSVLPLLFT